jgi:steroid 5-alpha reductase family enzyme
MSPLDLVIIIASVASLFAWVASLVSGDTSWVDRMWSIVPVVYVWVFAAYAHLDDVRLNVMAVLVTLWGVRLTFNFARKGGYSGVEDYRWPILRAGMTRWQFQLFNLFFIVIYQMFLLVLITLPALTAYNNQGTSFGFVGVGLSVLFLLLLAGETIADQQQWNFHKVKHADIAAGRTPSSQFLQSGLFKYSRHPNYFFEVSQWWVVYLFGAVAAVGLVQWTIAGVVLLSVLFVGSTRFTEQITLSKYPEYAEYQRRTSAVIPWFPRRPEPAVADAS